MLDFRISGLTTLICVSVAEKLQRDSLVLFLDARLKNTVNGKLILIWSKGRKCGEIHHLKINVNQKLVFLS